MSYDAFISYSHAADGRLAPAIKRGLERLGRGWSQVRALRVFRDDTDLAANPHLWSAITAALDESDWFVLLVSPHAASSPWVNREIDYWCERSQPEQMMIALTEGSLKWDAAAGDFNALTSDALPPSLIGRFAEEPRYLDLRWARHDEQLDLRHSYFREAIASLAAPMHNLTRDEMESEDVRRHRRTVRIRYAVSALIVALLVATLVSTTALYAAVADNARLKAKQAQADLRATQNSLADANRQVALANAAAAAARRQVVSQRGVAELQLENRALRNALASCIAGGPCRAP